MMMTMTSMPASLPQLPQLDQNLVLEVELLSRLSVDVILGLYFTSLVRQAGLRGVLQCLMQPKSELVDAGDDDDDDEEEEEYEEEEEEDGEEGGEGEEEEEEEEEGGDGQPPAKRQKRDDDDDKKKEEGEGEEEEEEEVLSILCRWLM